MIRTLMSFVFPFNRFILFSFNFLVFFWFFRGFLVFSSNFFFFSSFFFSNSRFVCYYNILFGNLFWQLNSLFYFVNLSLVGLGFSIVFVDYLIYKLFIGFSHFLYIYPSFFVFIFVDNEVCILLISWLKNLLYDFVFMLLNVRRANRYKLSGIFSVGLLFSLKDNRHNK